LKVDLEGCLSSDQNGGSGVKVFILHADVQGGSASLGNYTCIPLRDLVSLPVDYWALGHIHQYLELSTNPRVVYSGTIQGRSIKPAECGEKGGVLVKIENGHIVKTEFKSFSPIVFKQLEIRVDQVLSESDFILAIKNSIKEQVVLCEKPQIVRLSIETSIENRKSFNLKSREEEFVSTLREVVFRELNCSVERVKWVNVRELSSPLTIDILEQVDILIKTQFLSGGDTVREILKSESPLKGVNTDLNLEEVLEGARDRIKSLLGCSNE
jgi:DNA repair exonuclease SbcCD nuclease subunit